MGPAPSFRKQTGSRAAIADFDLVIYHNREDVHAYFNRGLAYGLCAADGDQEKAINDFEKVVELLGATQSEGLQNLRTRAEKELAILRDK